MILNEAGNGYLLQDARSTSETLRSMQRQNRADDIMWAINDLTHNRLYDCTMPRSGDWNHGYAFVTIAWPSEFVSGVDTDTFCEAIYRLDIKGRPIYAKEAHHHDK